MSPDDDYSADMFDALLDDALEDALRGSADPHDDPVARVVAEIRRSGQQVPRPSEDLTRLLTDGLEPGEAPGGATVAPPLSVRSVTAVKQNLARISTRLTALGAGMKVLLGTGVAVAAIGGGGAAGVLPEPAQQAIDQVLQRQADGGSGAHEADAPDGSGDSAVAAVDTGTDTRPENFGDRVSPDARGEDGTPGVDGQIISEEAKQNGNGNAASGEQPPADPPAGAPAEAGGAEEAPAGPPAETPARPPAAPPAQPPAEPPALAPAQAPEAPPAQAPVEPGSPDQAGGPADAGPPAGKGR